MVDVFAITMALMAGSAGLPNVLIRFYTVRGARAARWSAMWALVFIGMLYTTAPAIATFARVNMIQTLNQIAYEEAPEWFVNWEKTGLIEFDDKDGDGIITYSGDPERNELIVDPDIMVLANPEIARLPDWVVGLVAAGGLAAALSTAAGLLLVVSSAVSHDLLKRAFMPGISEKAELAAARVSAGVAVLIAGYLGVNPPDYVAAVVAFAFGLAASSFFPAIIMGIFSKRMNREGAIAGMICGISFTASYIIYFKFIDTAANTPENWWFGISPEGIGTLGMLINFAVAAVVSALTPAPPPEVQELIEHIRIPRGAGRSHEISA